MNVVEQKNNLFVSRNLVTSIIYVNFICLCMYMNNALCAIYLCFPCPMRKGMNNSGVLM
jgi:hypothetical protein